MAHAELEDPRERTRRQARDQRLQDADLGVRLHQAHQAEDRLPRHHAVRVEHDHVVEAVAPTPAEISDVADLAAIADPAAGNECVRGVVRRPPCLEQRLSRAARSGLRVSPAAKISNAPSPVSSTLASTERRWLKTRSGSSL